MTMRPERCPVCYEPLIERVAGLWCPACRGWLIQITTPAAGDAGTYVHAWSVGAAKL